MARVRERPRRAGELDPGRAHLAARIASGLLVVDLLYVLWINYVAFVGGNWPLTPFHFSSGSPGQGTAMLAVGDWLLLLLLFFVVNPVIMAGVHLVLRRGSRRPPRRAGSVQQRTRSTSRRSSWSACAR